MDDLNYWLILNRCPRLSPRKLFKLLEHCKTPQAIVEGSAKEWKQWGFSEKTISFLKGDIESSIKSDINWVQQHNCHILRFIDKQYPVLLKEIVDPPLVLYVQGEPSILNHPQIAVVGSRNPTPQGKDNAINFGRALSQSGLTITSGMALGIDGAAHQGAISTDCKTIAVIGTGLDRVYPARHKQLAHEIVNNGAIVSEFPIGTGVKPGHFPRRNRIISGLSLGVLVVEAAIKSGSLISAHMAMDQGREVFAIPGSIHNTLARGCHLLIQQGAKLVETANDIVEELSAMALFQTRQIATNNAPTNKHNFELDNEQQMILGAVDFDNTTIDQIIVRTDLPSEVVSGTLLILELENLIYSTTNGYCKRGD